MNSIAKIESSMTTSEVAKLAGRRHDNVVRDLRTIAEELEINLLKFEEVYIAGNGQEQTEYRLDKELTLTLTSGYSVKQRHAIVKRWLELEAKQAPTNFADALQLAADQQREVQRLEALREADRPNTELGEAFSAQGYITRRDWVKLLKAKNDAIREKDVNTWLSDSKYIYKDQLTGEARAYAHYEHLLVLRLELINGAYRQLLMVTNEGVKVLTPKILKAFEGVVL